MKKFIYFLIAGVIIILVVVYARGDKSPTGAGGDALTETNGEEIAGNDITVTLAAQNNSGESGTAVLTEIDGSLMVTGSVSGAPVDILQPAHIHSGSCAALGGIAYPLTSFANGSSETILDISFNEFIAKAKAEPLAINLHKSQEEIGVSIACGDITVPADALIEKEDDATRK